MRISAEDLVTAGIYPMIGQCANCIGSAWLREVEHGEYDRQGDSERQRKYAQPNGQTNDKAVGGPIHPGDLRQQPNQEEDPGQRVRWDHLPARTLDQHLGDGDQQRDERCITQPEHCLGQRER